MCHILRFPVGFRPSAYASRGLTFESPNDWHHHHHHHNIALLSCHGGKVWEISPIHSTSRLEILFLVRCWHGHWGVLMSGLRNR